MREKLYNTLKKVYGIVMTIAFFAGIIPLIPFVVAMIIGGANGEKIAVFLSENVYPVIIVLASIAVLLGWIAMYVGKKEGLSVKSVSGNSEK